MNDSSERGACIGAKKRADDGEAAVFPTIPVAVFDHTAGMSDREAQGRLRDAESTGGEPNSSSVFENMTARWKSGRRVGSRVDPLDSVIVDRDHATGAGAQLAALVRSTRAAVVTWTTDGKVVDWNEGAARLFGYGPDEVCGHDVGLLSMACERRAFRGGEVVSRVYERELEMRHKNGGPVHVAWTAAVVRDAAGQVVGVTGIGTDVSERVQLEREVAMTAEHQRRQLGYELHDSLGQQLTAIGLLVSTLIARIESRQTVADVSKKIEHGIDAAKMQLRTLLKGWAPVELDGQGLVVALQELARSTQYIHDVACRLECTSAVAPFVNAIANQLYLIAREAVHNAIKHARPHSIVIRLESGDGIRMTVEDDGSGVDDGDNDAGLGVRIMRYRCGIIGGTLTIERGRAGGTVLGCRCPDVSTAGLRVNWLGSAGSPGVTDGTGLQRARSLAAGGAALRDEPFFGPRKASGPRGRRGAVQQTDRACTVRQDLHHEPLAGD